MVTHSLMNASVKHILLALIYTVLFYVFSILIGLWVFLLDPCDIDNIFLKYSDFIIELTVLVALVLFTILNKQNRKEFTLKAKWFWYAIAIVFGALFLFIQTPLNWFYNYVVGDNYNIQYTFDNWEAFTYLNVYSSILLVPIAEELFFRQFIQRKLQKHTSAIVAIIVTTLLFAAIHIPFYLLILGYPGFNFHHAYIVFFGALMLCFVYYKSRSIGPAIAMHIAWNTMAFIC